MKKNTRFVRILFLIALAFFSFTYQHVKAITPPLVSRMNLELPTSNDSYDKLIRVVGWALEPSGVKEVNIYLDNSKIGQAIINLPRSDVNAAFPGYTLGDKSGFLYEISIENISKGNHNLKVEVVSKSGTTQSINRSIAVGKLGPIICLDTPVEKSVIQKDQVYISGWSLDGSGVKEVNVYFDKNFLAKASIGFPRPDVKACFPTYNNGLNSGYEYTVDLSTVSPGNHVITIESVGNDNSKAYLERVIETVKKPFIYNMESPGNNQNFNNSEIYIGGWALNSSGMKEINIYVDNKFINKAVLGLTRNDVKAVFSNYLESERSGYEYRIDSKTLSTGKHTITLEYIGKDGSINKSNRDINVIRKKPLICTETPSDNISIGNTKLYISGWALNDSGLKEVNLFLDNQPIKTINAFYDRLDVNAVFPGYFEGVKSGYEYSMDTTTITPGKHKISMVAVGKDGTTVENSRTINIVRKTPLMNIETLVNNTIYNNRDIKIVGWALHDAGIKQVKIYVDGNYVENAIIGGLRPDVNSAIPGYYNGVNSGYEYLIKADSIRSGTHTIIVEVIGNDNTSIKANRIVEVTKLPELMNIESPVQNKTYANPSVNVSGWALNASGIKQIAIYLDNQLIGNATKGLYRPDVNSAFPGYSSREYSGYSYTLPSEKLTIGVHSIKVQVIGNDGSQKSDIHEFIMYGYVTYKEYSNALSYYVDNQFIQGVNYNWKGQEETYERVSYYMNPQNFIGDGDGKYMFLKLKYFDGISISDLNKILAGKGVLEGKGSIFLAAGKASNVNPIYLLSHSLLETGNGTSNLCKGILVSSVGGKSVEPRVTYNMFGIGAVDGQADKAGSEYAYNQGWFTVDDAIMGGAQWIGNGYINSTKYQQDTLYKMKWNYDVIWHEYATDIEWAYKQTNRIRKLIEQLENSTLYFEVPTFKN